MRAINILEQAVSDPIGIKLTVENAHKSRTMLYKVRNKLKESDIHSYDGLTIFQMSETELWLIHQSAIERYRDEHFEQDLDKEISSLISGGR